MITHAGSRTRAIYRWHDEDLRLREGVWRSSRANLYMIRDLLWSRFESYRPLPSMSLNSRTKESYCIGYSQIVIAEKEADSVIVTHEVVHALGYGSPTNPHSRGYALAFIKALAAVHGWDKDELKIEANRRGLI